MVWSTGSHQRTLRHEVYTCSTHNPVEDLVQHVTTMHHPATHYAYGVDLLVAYYHPVAAIKHGGHQVTCDDLVVTWGPQ